ncbi:MAG: hypothetical protein MR839_01975 [Spirochaetia bacterium]|nr:hypothetical protein [Spirochaetia bacterium]
MYTLQELKDAVVELYKNNTLIPKPNTSARILKIAVANIHGEEKDSFYYLIGSSRTKAVPFDTLYAAYQRLTETGTFSRAWYRETFPAEARSRPCNFSTIGGVLVVLGFAEYMKNGVYRRK